MEGGEQRDGAKTALTRRIRTVEPGQSLPRIYYYRTRHYKPEAQENDGKELPTAQGGATLPSQPAAVPSVAGKTKSDPATRPRASLWQMLVLLFSTLRHFVRQALAMVLGAPKFLRTQVSARLVVFVLLLFIVIWWLNWDQTPSSPETTGVPGGFPFPHIWEQKMKAIAVEEATGVWTERKSALENAVQELELELAELKKQPNPSQELKREIEKLQEHLKAQSQSMEASFRKSETAMLENIKNEVATLRNEVKTELTKALENNVHNIESPTDHQQRIENLKHFDNQLKVLQEQIRSLNGESQKISTKVNNIQSSFDVVSKGFATKTELAALSADVNKLTAEGERKFGEVEKKLSRTEEKILELVQNRISPQFIEKEVFRIVAETQALEETKLRNLAALVASQQKQLVDVANTVAAFHPELSKNPTPQEVLNVIRPTVDKWIREAIQEAQSSLVQATQPFVKSPEELLKSQEQAVQNWLVQYMHKELPRLLEQGSATLSSSIQEQLKEVSKTAHQVEERVTKSKEEHKLVLDASTIDIIVKQLRSERVGSSLSLEDVKRIVETQLEAFAADRINMTDFALAAGGASIITSKTSRSYKSGLFDWLRGTSSHPPAPGSVVGQCWAFAGDFGYVTVKLPFPIKPSGFSLDHIPRGVAFSTTSAPKNFRVWGLKTSNDADPIILVDNMYDIEGKPVQTFSVKLDDTRANETLVFQYYTLEVYSNHGNEEYTCVYRFRVHGQPAVPLEQKKEATTEVTEEGNSASAMRDHVTKNS